MNNKINNLHRRQFVLGEKIVSYTNWNSIQLNETYFLSYCRSLPVKTGYDKDGKLFILIGVAIQLNKVKQAPIDELENSNIDINEILSSWGGRWILFYHDRVYTDFSSLLGCHYTWGDSGLWFSSSVSLLSNIKSINNNIDANIFGKRMNWFPPPGTNTKSINTLLPSQVFNLRKENIEIKQLFPVKKKLKSESEALNLIKDYLVTGLKNINSNSSENIWIPLSAGYDSRLLLAAAKYADIPVKTYTMKKKNSWSFFSKKPLTSTVSKADMELPKKIAKDAKVKHRFIKKKKLSTEKIRLFDEHTNKQTFENDRVYFSNGQWDWSNNDDIILLGQVFEMGHCFYYNRLNYFDNNISIKEIADKFSIPKHSISYDLLLEYVEWCKYYEKTYNEDVDWRDKFYLEQRLAGWLSSLQQGLDLVDGERIHLANSQDLICALLSLSKDTRINLLHQKKLIKMMAPELLNQPFNPSDPFLYKIKRKVANISRRSLREIWSDYKRKIK